MSLIHPGGYPKSRSERANSARYMRAHGVTPGLSFGSENPAKPGRVPIHKRGRTVKRTASYGTAHLHRHYERPSKANRKRGREKARVRIGVI